MKVKLVVVEGKPLHREIPLPSTVFVIGRDPQCHLRPHSELVSKMHCAIARKSGKVVLRDLQSSNGTFLNENRIKGEVAVNDGDRLRVGDLVFAFKITEPEGGGSPVQIVDEGDVHWLMATPSDSSVLEPARQTQLISNPPKTPENGAAAKADPPAKESTGGSRAISAGQYLREYFRKRR